LWQEGGEVVIRFKCIYCGQRILAPDNGAGKKGHCPKCQHHIVVPHSVKDRPAINTDIPEKLQKAREAMAVLSTDKDAFDDSAELWGEKPGWFIPSYDELTLFLMAAAFISLYFANSTMREQIYKGITAFDDLRVYFLVVVIMGGMGLSIFHIFTRRTKSDYEKRIMLIFAVLTNAISGIAAGVDVIRNTDSPNLLIVFPLWNIINGVLMLLLMRGGFINERCIADRDATAGEVIFGLLAMLVIFIFCNYVFKLYWAITFSICIIYATSFDKALQSVFPGLAHREDYIPNDEVNQ
jgi:DNA-directed RNA polymerase subunit RPC12/RpoP